MPRDKSNIIPNSERTPDERKKIARAGGIQSGKVRKEKKLLSQIYAELLADQAGIKGGRGFKEVVREIMNSTDPRAVSARVSLMKEIREATEGSKHLLGSDPDKPFDMTINIIGVESKTE